VKYLSLLALLSTAAIAVAAPSLVSLFCVAVVVACSTVNAIADAEAK
jgi:hypothetical protein